jgi:transposase-like protein
MDATVFSPPVARRHRRHSAEFNARVVSACVQPGVSIPGVALANELNANQVRSWVKAHRDQQRALVPANVGSDRPPASANCLPPRLVPVTAQATDARPASDIQLEISRQQTVVNIRWKSSEAMAFAQWLRDLLR